MSNLKGQVTLFAIIAILIAAVVVFAVLLSRPFGLPSRFSPAEDEISRCISDSASDGLRVLGEQGGFIKAPEFEPGSEFAPFSSQIGFFGSIMPYWTYLSSNGQYKEQVPSIGQVQSQLNDYIKDSLEECSFDSLELKGFNLTFGDAENVQALIRDEEVFVDVEWPIVIEYQGSSRRFVSHSVKVKSSFGRLYGLAKKIYQKEKDTLFLESYTQDIISLYAPGTGVELTCSPKVWDKGQVTSDLLQALKGNIPTVKISGNYYDLGDKERGYFVKEIGVKLGKEQVGFLYDDKFPTKISIEPSSGEFLRADPIGNQEGLGVLGFCYVPYHFVYTVAYPVIVQIFDENYGLFQFPIIVSVENNLPRGSQVLEGFEDEVPALCRYKVQEFVVVTKDIYGKDVDADVSFKCAETSCTIGKSDDGIFEGVFPQCINGFVVAQKEDYVDAKEQVSTNEEGSVLLILKPKHTLDVRVLKDLEEIEDDESALIIFSSPEITQSIIYPTQKSVELADGNYKVTAYLFKEGKITLSAQEKQQCVDSPRGGFLGALGFTREECFTISQPEQELTQVTIGGGTGEVSFGEDELSASSFVGVEVNSNPLPKNVLELQEIYNKVFASSIGVVLHK